MTEPQLQIVDNKDRIVGYAPPGGVDGHITRQSMIWLQAPDSAMVLASLHNPDHDAFMPWGPAVLCDVHRGQSYRTSVASASDRDLGLHIPSLTFVGKLFFEEPRPYFLAMYRAELDRGARLVPGGSVGSTYWWDIRQLAYECREMPRYFVPNMGTVAALFATLDRSRCRQSAAAV